MKTLILSGLPWRAISPSIYVLQGYPVWLTFNGEAWYLAINGDYDNARPWPSRDCAAAAITAAFLDHQLQEQGLL